LLHIHHQAPAVRAAHRSLHQYIAHL
jgi:hypothetical protein